MIGPDHMWLSAIRRWSVEVRTEMFWIVCTQCGTLGERKYRQNAEMTATEHEVAHPGHTAHVEPQN